MAVLVGKSVPDFSAKAVIEGTFKDVKLSDYRGKYVVMFFYPLISHLFVPLSLPHVPRQTRRIRSAREVIGGLWTQSTHI